MAKTRKKTRVKRQSGKVTTKTSSGGFGAPREVATPKKRIFKRKKK